MPLTSQELTKSELRTSLTQGLPPRLSPPLHGAPSRSDDTCAERETHAPSATLGRAPSRRGGALQDLGLETRIQTAAAYFQHAAALSTIFIRIL